MLLSCCDAWLRLTVNNVTGHVCGEIYARVCCILQYVYDVVVKKVHVRYLIF